MNIPEIAPRFHKKIDEIPGGMCFLYGRDLFLKVLTHYFDNNIHAVRLADGAQIKFDDAEMVFEVVGPMKVSLC